MVGNTPVVVGRSVVRVQLDDLVVVLYRLLVLALPTVGITPVVVGQGVFRVQLDGLIVVIDGPLVLAQFTVGITPVAVASRLEGSHVTIFRFR